MSVITELMAEGEQVLREGNKDDAKRYIDEACDVLDELLGLYRDSNAQRQATIIGAARLQPGMEEQPASREVRGA